MPRLYPALLLHPSVLFNFTVNTHRNEPSAIFDQKLHHVMALLGQFAPSARLFRILLDGFVTAPIHAERDPSQTLRTGPPHSQALPTNFKLITIHEVLSNFLQKFPIQHSGGL
jgi:hypothetical protein